MGTLNLHQFLTADQAWRLAAKAPVAWFAVGAEGERKQLLIGGR